MGDKCNLSTLDAQSVASHTLKSAATNMQYASDVDNLGT